MMTDQTTFVVRLIEPEDGKPFKHFGSVSHACAYAKQQVEKGEAARAEVYCARNIQDARQAIAAAEAGSAELIWSKVAGASEEEVKRADEKAWDRALADGDTEAMLKMLGLL